MATRPRRIRVGAGLLLAQQRVAAPELVLAPADGPAEPGLVGRDVERDVLAVQRVAHLGAQRVPGAEPAGQHAVVGAGRDQGVPQGHRHVVGGDQLVAALAGVAGPADDDTHPVVTARQLRLDERHVVVTGRQPDRVEHLVGPGPLDGQHGVVVVVVGDRHALGRRLGEPPHDLGGVGRVGDQQHPLVGVEVGDQVVDDPAGLRVAAQRVLRLAVPDLAAGRWSGSR